MWTGPYFSPEVGELIGSPIASGNTMLLGRVPYQRFAEAFGSQSGGMADTMSNFPKVVVSTTLERADWRDSTLISGAKRLFGAQTVRWDSRLSVRGRSAPGSCTSPITRLADVAPRAAVMRRGSDAVEQVPRVPHSTDVVMMTLPGPGSLRSGQNCPGLTEQRLEAEIRVMRLLRRLTQRAPGH
jgi:hypothetical protein